VTYDVSRGHGVEFVGMTRDGSKVFFITSESLEATDTDESDDLYMWSENGDTITRISDGNGQGNADGCNASWTSNCSVAAIRPENEHPYGRISVAGLDDKIARESGDVYFYSPSSLDPDRPGLANQRNLYVYREGSVHLVATLEAGTPITRMQISPDGSHAA